MTDDELKRLLQSAPAPERDEDYWREFPENVSRRIRAQSTEDAAQSLHRRPSFTLRWGFGLAGLAVLIAVALLRPLIQETNRSQPHLPALSTYYRNMVEMFPHQFTAMIVNSDGVQLQLSDQPDVPSSPPLFVRICGPSARCTTAVTFSGQSIEVDGKEFEILATGQGEILVLAQEGVVTPKGNPLSGQRWHVESGWLTL